MSAAAVFVDTFYWLALINSNDAWHARAVDWAGVDAPLVTSDAVLVEVADALCRRRHRALAVDLVDRVRSDGQVTTVPMDEALFDRAFALYRERRDKDWSLTDCTSFEIMRREDLTRALTGDIHFAQAGFQALLRDAPA